MTTSAATAFVKTWLKQLAGPRLTTAARLRLRRMPVPRWGNLRRLQPFSSNFGFERGAPIDRFYLDRFLERHREAITGDVLEIQVPAYTRRYGHDVRLSHTVDILPQFAPTYVCDLAHAEAVIPADRYDCFLLPNTLNVLKEIESCLRQALRVVRPGGVVLASAGVLEPLCPDVPDYWHLSAEGWVELTSRVWPGCDVEVTGWGNCVAATAAMLGLAGEELTDDELLFRDRRFPVLVTIACRKASR